MTMSHEDNDANGSYSLAFSQGADARLAGLGLTVCPYRRSEDSGWLGWRRGWIDCSHHWGEMVRYRWTFAELPKLNGRAPASDGQPAHRRVCNACDCARVPARRGAAIG